MTDKQLNEIKSSISKVVYGLNGIDGTINTTNEKLDSIKFGISKLSLKLGSIKTESQTANGHLEKFSQSIDKVVTILEKGFQSITLKGGTSSGVDINATTKPLEKVVNPELEEKKSKEFKLTPLLKPLNQLEKTIHKVSNIAKKGLDEVQRHQKDMEQTIGKLGDKLNKVDPHVEKPKIAKSINRLLGGVPGTIKAIGSKLKNTFNDRTTKKKDKKSIGTRIKEKFSKDNRTKAIEKVQGGVEKIKDKFTNNVLPKLKKGFKIALNLGMVGTGMKLLSVSWWRKRLGGVKKISLKSIKGLKKKIESMTINPKKMVEGLKKGFDSVSKSFGKGVEGMTSVKSGLEGMNSLMKSAGIESEGMSKAVKGVTLVLTVLSTAQALAAAGKWAMSLAQWDLNAAIAANPIGAIVLGIIALITLVAIAWDKFEGFRGTIVGMWEVLKSFGTVIKDFVINRIKGILSGITGLGSALVKLFSGDFSGAWKTAKQAVSDFVGVDDYVNAGKGFAKSTSNIKENFDKGYQEGVNSKFKFGDSLGKMFSGKKNAVGTTLTSNTNTKGGKIVGATHSAGKSVKIDTMVKEINISTNTLKESSAEIKQQLIKILKEALQDSQTAVAINTH